MNSAEEVVEKQLAFYNAHDLKGFCSTYTDTIEIYDLPAGTLRFKGNEALKARYALNFETKPHARIATRIVEGNKVIDHEYYIRDGMLEEASVVAIYEVNPEVGKISRVWFLK